MEFILIHNKPKLKPNFFMTTYRLFLYRESLCRDFIEFGKDPKV